MKKNLISVFILLFATPIHPQTFNITGIVTDALKTPIQHVNIIVAGTNIGTASDKKGRYKIENLQPAIYKIEFSALGYETRVEEVELEGKSVSLNVILKEKAVESDEVVVTAGKYEQKKSDLPVSAEIISGSEFLKKNFYNIEDALRYVPGVNMTDDQVSIRGSSGYSRGTGSRALFALDGLPFYAGDTGEIVWEMIPVTALQRVEVIKGAASSLYGSSAIGGVINAISKDIKNQPTTIVNAYYGFYDRPYYKIWDWSDGFRPFNEVTLSYSRKIENFGFNISFTRLEDSGYKSNNYSKKYIGFLKTAYEFSPVSSLTFIANTFNKRIGNFIYWKDSRNALIPTSSNLGESVETNRYLFGLIYKNVLSKSMFLNAKFSYYLNDWADNSTPVNKSKSNLYRGEFQLTTTITNKIILNTGIEALTSNVKSTLFGNPHSFGFGVYSLCDFKFDFPLILSLGIRYDYSKLDSISGSSAFSPKLGVNYKLLDILTLRSSVGTGFRAPTLAEAFTSTSASGITVKPNPYLKSESNLTMEVGVNYEAFNCLNFDIAVFRNEYYNMIEPHLDPVDGLVIFDNLVRARIEGFEGNTRINILSNDLVVNISYTYLWARDLKNNTALKYRPRHILYSGLEFNKWNLEFGIDFRFLSKVEEIDNELIDLGIVRDGELRSPVYVTDLRAGYNLISIGLPLIFYVNVKNLTNYNYVELIGNLRPIRNYSLGFSLML